MIPQVEKTITPCVENDKEKWKCLFKWFAKYGFMSGTAMEKESIGEIYQVGYQLIRTWYETYFSVMFLGHTSMKGYIAVTVLEVSSTFF